MSLRKKSVIILGIILGASLSVLFFNRHSVFRYLLLVEANDIDTLQDGTKVLADSDMAIGFIDSVYLDNIRIGIEKSNEFLKVNTPKDLMVYITQNEELFSTSVSVIEAKFISLIDRGNYFPPLIHEYMHIHQGRFNELWYQEGMADYLSLLITKEYDLKSYYAGYTWVKYMNAWKKSDSDVNWTYRDELAFIDDLKLKYSTEKIKSILRFEENINYDDLENINEFYRLSASFCEFISKGIGVKKIKEIHSIANEAGAYSVIEICNSMGIDLEAYYDLWLNDVDTFRKENLDSSKE